MRLPALIDRPTLQAELGVTEHVAERIMRQLNVIRPSGLRKVYVRRQDVARYLEEATVEHTDPATPRASVSAWIQERHKPPCSKRKTNRLTCTCPPGWPRYMVMYRRGGRGTNAENANTFRTKREARARRDLVAGWLALGLNPREELAKLIHPPKKRTLDDWWEAFIASRVDVAPKTLLGYEQARGVIVPALGHIPIADLRPADIQEWILGEDRAPGTLHGYLSTLRMVLDHADVEPNPARSRKLRLPADTSEEPTPPRSAEWYAIRDHIADDTVRVCARLMECLGLRVSEAVQLLRGDIDLEAGKLRVSKARTKGRTSGQRWLPVPDELVAHVDEEWPRERRVFPGLTADRVRSQLAAACVAGKVDHYHPHDLRHRRISLWAVVHRFDLVTVRVWSGHSKLELTNRYSHVVIDNEDEWGDFWRAAYVAERAGYAPAPVEATE